MKKHFLFFLGTTFLYIFSLNAMQEQEGKKFTLVFPSDPATISTLQTIDLEEIVLGYTPHNTQDCTSISVTAPENKIKIFNIKEKAIIPELYRSDVSDIVSVILASTNQDTKDIVKIWNS